MEGRGRRREKVVMEGRGRRRADLAEQLVAVVVDSKPEDGQSRQNHLKQWNTGLGWRGSTFRKMKGSSS